MWPWGRGGMEVVWLWGSRHDGVEVMWLWDHVMGSWLRRGHVAAGPQRGSAEVTFYQEIGGLVDVVSR